LARDGHTYAIAVCTRFEEIPVDRQQIDRLICQRIRQHEIRVGVISGLLGSVILASLWGPLLLLWWAIDNGH